MLLLDLDALLVLADAVDHHGFFKQAVDHVAAVPDSIVDELHLLALLEEQDRGFGPRETLRHLDAGSFAVVVDGAGAPWGLVPADFVVGVDVLDRGAAEIHRDLCALFPSAGEVRFPGRHGVLRVAERHERHVIRLPRHELELVHAPVGVDDQVGFEVHGVGFDDHVRGRRRALPDVGRQDAPAPPVPDVHPGHDLAWLAAPDHRREAARR